MLRKIKISNGVKIKIIKTQKGVAALFAIVIIAAGTLLMAYTASLLGLGELDLGYTFQKGAEAFSVADGCVEESLRRIRLDTSYGIGEGDISLSVSNGSCIINVVDLGGNQRRISVAGISSNYNKRIQAEISLIGNIININSWEELTN